MLVSEYSVTREYGGPEEGGWWYDRSEFVRVIHHGHTGARGLTDDEMYAYARQLNERERARRREAGERDRYSVLGGADTVYYAEHKVRDMEENLDGAVYC